MLHVVLDIAACVEESSCLISRGDFVVCIANVLLVFEVSVLVGKLLSLRH